MLYSAVAKCYADLEGMSGRKEITAVLAGLLKATPVAELPSLVYMTQGKLRPDYEGVELGLAEKLALRALAGASGAEPARVYSSYVKHGDIGAAAEELLTDRSQGTLFSEALTLRRVYETLLRVARQSGSGSVEAKLRELASLLNDASPLEARYVMRTVAGELRLGVADYTVLDAAATAFLGGKEARPRIERAYNVHPDLGFVVAAVASRGIAGVDDVKVEVGVPIRPMLAERLSSAQAIIEKMEGKVVAAEYKLDGERLQIHRSGDDVKLFSRRLEVVTSHYPDAADLVRAHVSARNAILEAEVVAIDEDTGEYLPFQELMHRRRKHGIQQAIADYPVALNFFDILLAGSSDLTGKPYSFRRKKLRQTVEETSRTRPVPALSTSDPGELEKFMEDAITDGCEGLVVKDPDSSYRAGAREFAWIKLKREYRSELTDTLDLVVIGAFHGRGRRAGTFGTFLLGTYDTKRGVYASVAKVGTGFSDEDLAKFPRLLEPYESHVRPPGVESKMVPDVWFRPHLVIEIIAAELTLSPIHTAAMGSVRPEAGISLRFPKFTGKVRDDKRPEDSTSVDEIVGMYRRQVKRVE
ncbi:MAG: ATP-dependent DNA ligase [Nitrososphaerota archaeon]|jgi:DNA ligase-1|nr:ATP-dependent DNA ligase [Nitrososphaerota archaeon]MDG6937113.1 ATP-dependent DNA ligase [Nitrososphaerota archaeon]MDG6969824.1 ATP-dependent DNA ligase [Nitrososphaerota archaeon]MDG6972355.1 ATP-dependent DNA ligase [Nitrososphaerota archaeon]MDG6980091.1 ATP-dependent DNA ligase [Nitrososphaerota archaeon]